ncbi:phospholipase D family protein [Tepidibacter hydrothermalis]|uniref:Phospholipase D family protein n=1 Tax=Tepidibacter hydrothermalis TaxID=3036126 RepID=A0ABY8EA43_9FIRM|nr:phospholipase D family protein [Tepidibacter hydrothermalis]WFD09787.1 phospholipase D family protein [Tepidibacter hydrothermalis]
MRIINNLNGNHKDEILSLIEDADEFILVSPFLMESFEQFLKDIKNTSIKSIRLITTLKDGSPELFKKVKAIKSYRISCIQNNDINYSVQINNNLHGKIYIAMKGGNPIRGIITSANFTERGLNHGHEWGVEITEAFELIKIIDDLNSLSTKPLSNEELNKIIIEVDKHPEKEKFEQGIKVNIRVSHLYKQKLVKRESERRYFIKPIGSKDSPYTEGMRPKSDTEELHFAKKPIAVRPGDILICYGVVVKKLLGYFEVISEYDEMRPGDRWPWGVNVKNLLPEYSDNWPQFGNTLAYVQSTYYGNSPITDNGGNNLNSLMYGQDKIRLTNEFAQHLIGIMNKSVLKTNSSE